MQSIKKWWNKWWSAIIWVVVGIIIDNIFWFMIIAIDKVIL